MDAHLFVIFGGSGDLAKRKLLPAIAAMVRHAGEPACHVLGVGRTPLDETDYQHLAAQSVAEVMGESDATAWAKTNVHYASTDDENGGFEGLAERIVTLEQANGLPGNRVFYLAIPPTAFESVVDGLGSVGLSSGPGWTRLVVEKPIGHDLASAQALNNAIHRVFDESQIYRIDHYLGKETVQNLLVFRFANHLFESTWNRDRIALVEITVAEELGVEGRAGYYDQTGALRDMIQNHLTQLMTLVAMEPPVDFSADAIRDEKVKVLRSIEPIHRNDVVFGQYGPGAVEGESVPGYLEDPDVPADSNTPTSVIMRLRLNSWRWQGVPFYLRTGKRFPERLTQIAVTYREPPVALFGLKHRNLLKPDVLRLELQPNEGFELYFDVKVPGSELEIVSIPFHFSYDEAFGRIPEAYETLLADVVEGDQTLFVRADEVEAAWSLYQPILDDPPRSLSYAAGEWGPDEGNDLLAHAQSWFMPDSRVHRPHP
ncbi:MAG: glucose-6-phosphate dehydrogenase [Acidimicrobiia bacterium]|nr:glucose-6-phosphate dehydrogenase [Acidimicrobiia bacterium]